MTSFEKPTNELIEETLPLLSSPQHEANFFSRLENPLWITPLADHNFFSYPPSTEEIEGGGVRFPSWPPSSYLARMASLAPEKVSQVFAGIDTDNPTIVHHMIRAALEMPPEHAASLDKVIRRSIERSALWIDFDNTSNLILHLIEGNQNEIAFKLSKTLFADRINNSGVGFSKRDEHSYKIALQKVSPTLAKAVGVDFLAALCSWLCTAVKKRKSVNLQTGEDLSYIWRPAIEEHEQNRDFNFEGVLVGITRSAFEASIKAEVISLEDSLKILQKQPFQVFERIIIHLINVFANLDPILARQAMLNRDLFNNTRFKHEYAMLIGCRWNILEPDEKSSWYRWIDDGPDKSRYEESMGEKVGPETSKIDRQKSIRWWQYERLHWIRDHLLDERLDFYNEMRAEHGEPELADLNFRVGAVWLGEKSPMTVDELSKKSFVDAVDTVSTWQPEGPEFTRLSIEGLASTFKQYLATDCVAFSSQAPEMIGRPAIYVRNFISQMTESVKANEAIDLPPIFDLFHWVVGQPVDERTTPEQDNDAMVDHDWQWTRNEISHFIEQICKARTDAGPVYQLDGIRETVWEIVNALCQDHAKSYVIYDIEEDDPRVHDYLHLGINSPRGKAIQAALEYAHWVADHIKIEDNSLEIVPGGFEAMPEFRDMLAWQINAANRTYEAMSIFGSSIWIIYWIDPDWLETNADDLFDLTGIERSPMAAEGWAAWNAFMVWVKPHIEYYQCLKKQFVYVVEQAGAVELTDRSREQPMHHLGEHLMVLYGRGQLDFDDDGGILQRFIETANQDIRRHAIGFIGHSLEGYGNLPEEVLQRFMSLWEMYWDGPGRQDAHEQPDALLFGTWFSCGKFPNQWALDRLHEFVEITPRVEPDYSVVERLAEIADADILKVTTILDLIVRGDIEGWRVSSWVESAEAIIGQAMEAGGEVQHIAMNLINHLGRRGYDRFGKLLDI